MTARKISSFPEALVAADEDYFPLVVNGVTRRMTVGNLFSTHPGAKGDRGLQGLIGPKGLTGDKGDKGDTGEKGDRGIQGLTGSKGTTGDTGDVGLKGDKGDTGERGLQGLPGSKGDTGDKGDIGLKGDKGDPGERGLQGLTGIKGDTGDIGLKGDKGDTGDRGLQGLTGSKGDTGGVGLKGDKGDTGDRGLQGLTGSKGDTGDKGDIGLKGDKGDAGERGLQGLTGSKGDAGAVGISTLEFRKDDLTLGTPPVVNFKGAGITSSLVNGVTTFEIPGQTATSTVLSASSKVLTSYTLEQSRNNSIIPCASVTITVPVGTLSVGYSVILLQDDANQVTVVGAPGVLLKYPNGLKTNGQYSTLALLQIQTDVWLVTTGNDVAQAVVPTSVILGGDNHPGVIVLGGLGATYTQTDGLVTVTKAAHGFTAADHNGRSILMLRGTGLFGFSNLHPQGYGIKYYEVCRNFTYVNANTFTCVSQNLVASSGNIGEITDPAWNAPAINIPVPANFLGKNGWFKTYAMLTHNGSANAKYLSTLWGPDTLYDNEGTTYQMTSPSFTGTNIFNGGGLEMHALNSNTRQVLKEATLANGGTLYSGTGRPRYFTRDLTTMNRLTFGIRLASSADWALLEYAFLEVYPKA